MSERCYIMGSHKTRMESCVLNLPDEWQGSVSTSCSTLDHLHDVQGMTDGNLAVIVILALTLAAFTVWLDSRW